MTKRLELQDLKKNFLENNSFSSHSKLNMFAQDNTELFTETRIAFLSNFTFDALIPLICGELANQDYRATNYIADFDSIPETVFNPESDLYKFNPNFVIITHWLETLSTILTKSFISNTPDDIENEQERIFLYFKNVFSSLRKNSNAVILVNNFPLTSLNTLGILDIQINHSNTQALINLNNSILKAAREFNSIYIVDYFSCFARIGFENAYDSKYWHLARYPFGRKAMIPIANEYGKFFRSLTGKTKKCLVLDCDNTLWGGVIGEDGLSGIKIDHSHPGQSFRDFQFEVVNLYNRGILIALCSKNNETDVLEVFEKHPDMILKKEHLTSWQINWDDKATNLRRIASDLNIGIESLVFVDDNPFECNLVRTQVPEVTVIQVDKNTTLMRKQLLEHGLFDSLTFSKEDKERNNMYHSDRERKKLQASSGSLSDYLKSLGLTASIGSVNSEQVSRVAQLTQKTNQFNLTTKRYSEEEIDTFRTSSDIDIYYMRLEDRVSDLGIIGVAIIKKTDNFAEIDTLLMSCRALGRGAEKAFIYKIIHNTFKDGNIEYITGKYIETSKNTQVKDLLVNNNFEKTATFPLEGTINFVLHRNNELPSCPEWINLKEIK